jgi:hypothetical protein
LPQAGLFYAREIEQEIFYKKLQEPIGTRSADFVVEEKVISEAESNHRIGGCTSCPGVELPESIQITSWSVNQFWKQKLNL